MQKKLLEIRDKFPIFKTYPDLVYLDSASTGQKPQIVIDTVSDYYKSKNANIHRGVYKLAEAATEIFEITREKTAKFIGAKNSNEIIFTKNTNEAINLAAYGWVRKNLKQGDIIILSEMEHHANIVPWLRLKEEIGVELIYLSINKDYQLDYKTLFNVLSSDRSESRNLMSKINSSKTEISPRTSFGRDDIEKIKLVAITHASNVLGTINPIQEIVKYFKKLNPEIKFLLDAAQSVPHLPININKLGVDFLAFSSHKMLGPSGVGVLWAKEEILNEMDPLLVGSHMIKNVSKLNATWADVPYKFEVGTANLEGVTGLGAAIDFINNIGYEDIISYENELTEYALEELDKLSFIKLYGPNETKDRLGIFSFNIEGAHAHDVAQILDGENIAIRSGHHCAQVLMQALEVPATARASLYIYNTKEDIDKLIVGLKLVRKTLKI